MGDSLTAGTGIFASNIFHLFIENRGVTALGGGQGTWREYFTIPNIIKEFNPNLIGYAPYDSLTHQKASGFNVAEIAAMSRDLPYMAENLIRRIQYHPDVDMKKSWKLIGILIGANDFCSDMCWTTSGPWSILNNHKNDLIETLRTLKEKLPRTLVSIIPPPNLIVLAELHEKSLQCKITTDIECSCLLGLHWRPLKKEFSDIMNAWQRIDEEVANYPEFQTEEFAVVAQPFATNLSFPMKPDGTAEWRYLSSDCFHLSQIANARASIAIWKNMLEPVGRKTRDWSDNDTLACPTESQPYLTTLINSSEDSNSLKYY
ncbi:phospholipase B1, membrane-associated-like isoform X2 [Venturia canescens]|nr:phospholipase B1, membrane-associated-like isoform X2 [Venturia canescens]XP_043268881.1 phospholipase B1, membrane-associated-like isoform X2 [Venturia canescens]